jgi:DNA-binding protein
VAQFKKCKKLLDQKYDEVIIHALGRAINRALRLAIWLQDAMLHSIKTDMVTSSVKVSYTRFWL